MLHAQPVSDCSQLSVGSKPSGSRSKVGSTSVIQAGNQVFIEVGKYKENLVAVKTVHKESLTPSRSDLIELKQVGVRCFDFPIRLNQHRMSF